MTWAWIGSIHRACILLYYIAINLHAHVLVLVRQLDKEAPCIDYCTLMGIPSNWHHSMQKNTEKVITQYWCKPFVQAEVNMIQGPYCDCGQGCPSLKGIHDNIHSHSTILVSSWCSGLIGWPHEKQEHAARHVVSESRFTISSSTFDIWVRDICLANRALMSKQVRLK